MSETQITAIAALPEKLKKDNFNARFRFRECRKERLVNCASCAHIQGGVKREEVALCKNPVRLRPVKIARYWEKFWGAKGESENISLEMVCDAYRSRPLPSDIIQITFKEGEGAVLNSQWADCIHVDANCPYVIEEQRFAKTGGRTKYNRNGEVRRIDVSERVPGETYSDACDMSCCESILRPQICNPNTYRDRVGIHPNADDKKYFVRNAITRHEKKSNMSYEEAEAFFAGVEKIALDARQNGLHAQISAVSDYIYKHCNRLGSRPLGEAVNPVWMWGVFHSLAVPPSWKNSSSWQTRYDSTNSGADVWVYDERLFDAKSAKGKAFTELEPCGIIPCIDSKNVFRNVTRVDYSRLDERFYIRGILKPLNDEKLLSRGLTHFIDIREVSYHAYEHYWGESGIGFSGLASFHEQ